jgi:tetratricopeptide (TPR) repeat protein
VRRRVIFCLSLVVLCVAVYGQVHTHALVDWDDPIDIAGNPLLTAPSFATLGKALAEPHHGNWIPLTQLSLLLSRGLGGHEPSSYLLGNVLLHAAASVLLFLALARMTGAQGRSAFVAAVFAVHPLHVESVAWAAQRKDVLAGLFFAATLLAYARYAESPRSRARYALVLLLFAGGLLSKPSVVTLPLVLLLLDGWPLGRLRPGAPAGARGVLLEKAPMLALAAGASLVTLAVQRSGGGMAFAERELPLGVRLWNALDSYGTYVAQGLWPSGLQVFYLHPGEAISRGEAALTGALLAVATAGAFALARRAPYLLVGWLWYLVTLVPMIGFVQVGMQAHADRYAYLPLQGLAIALAWGAVDLVGPSRALRRALGAVALVVVAALAAAAHRQVAFWHDSVSLFGRAVALDPGNLVVEHRLAAALRDAGRVDESQQQYLRAIALGPRWALPRLELGGLHEDRGQLAAALRRYEEGLALDPTHLEGQASVGRVLLALGRPVEAKVALEKALAMGGDSAAAHAMLATAALMRGDDAEAIRRNREALAREPGLVSAANNLAWTLAASRDASLRDPAEAVRIAEDAVARLGRTDAGFLDTLAVSYAAAGRFDDAVRTGSRAAALAAEAGQTTMADEIRARVALYRVRRAFVEPARGKS